MNGYVLSILAARLKIANDNAAQFRALVIELNAKLKWADKEADLLAAAIDVINRCTEAGIRITDD